MCCCRIGILLYTVVQFAAVVCIVLGTPFDQFRWKAEERLGNTPCMTLWGLKEKCYETAFAMKPDQLFSACNDRLDRFKAAEGFAIISCAVFAAALLVAVVSVCCCPCLKWICLILNIVGVVTACVVWACMVDVYSKNRGDLFCASFKSMGFKYGAGFGLFVTGWCLDIVGIVCILLPF